jgi:hypothetical protein
VLLGWRGQIFVPDVVASLSEHLSYGWTFTMLPGTNGRIMGRHITQAWKPVLACSRWLSGEWGTTC